MFYLVECKVLSSGIDGSYKSYVVVGACDKTHAELLVTDIITSENSNTANYFHLKTDPNMQLVSEYFSIQAISQEELDILIKLINVPVFLN